MTGNVKFCVLITVFIFCISLVGCQARNNVVENQYDQSYQAGEDIQGHLENEEGQGYVYHIYKDILGVGGDEDAVKLPYSDQYYSIDIRLIRFVGLEDFDLWKNETREINPNGARDIGETNIITFVKDFKVSKEDFVRITKNPPLEFPDDIPAAHREALYKEYKDAAYSREEIEAIYSNDQVLINKMFVNEYALFHNGNIYTASWLAANSVEEYEKHGLTEEVINNYLKKLLYTSPVYSKRNGEEVMYEFKDEYKTIQARLRITP